MLRGRRLHPFWEAALGLSAAILFVALLPASWMPARLVFCLFFLLVFAVTIRHQTAVAYGTGLCAAVSYVLLLILRPEQQVTAALPHLFVEAFLLFICGIIMSDLSRLQRKRLATLEQQEASNNEISQNTVRRYQKALKVNEELERQILEQPASIATVSDKMVQLWKLDVPARYTAILDMLVYAVGVEFCALYIPYDKQFHLCASYPLQKEHSTPFLQLNDPLIERVMQTRQICTIRDSFVEGEIVPEQAPVIVGPLLNCEEQVIGIVVVEKIPLLKFTHGTIHLLTSLLSVASFALQTDPGRNDRVGQTFTSESNMTDHDNFNLNVSVSITK